MVDGEISGPTSVPKCHSPKYAELDVTKVTGNPILEKKGCSLTIKKILAELKYLLWQTI